MTQILVVRQSRAGRTDQLADAFQQGISAVSGDLDEPITVRERAALDATAADVLDAAAVVVATPEHFGSMAGATKHFFEEIWHECLDRTRGLPFQLLVTAGNDGVGTIESVTRLVTGLAWTEFRPPLLAVGDITGDHLAAAGDLGATLAVSLDNGLI